MEKRTIGNCNVFNGEGVVSYGQGWHCTCL